MSTIDIKSDNLDDIIKPPNNLIDKPKKNIKYSLSKKIGYGSFSDVYLAKDNLDNKFAVKRIDKKKLSPDRLDTFLKELLISEVLEHENIVKCYETFKTNNYWYIVLEHCNFMTLHEHNYIFRNMEISKEKEQLIKFYLLQFKESLKYLKQNNIIHRDLKPKNVLFKFENLKNEELKLTYDFIYQNKESIKLKLADFTFARHIDDKVDINGNMDLNYSICGSPLYMAPELFLGKVYNIKADLWSFGVIMYEMLFGNSPYMSYGPNSISKLSYLMQTKQIKYLDGYSDKCYLLLKSLLVIDPNDRIGWDEFLNHEWFNLNESIDIGISFDDIKEKPLNTTEEIFKMDEDLIQILEQTYNNKKVELSIIKESEYELLPDESEYNNISTTHSEDKKRMLMLISQVINTNSHDNILSPKSEAVKIKFVDDWFKIESTIEETKGINKLMSPNINILSYNKVYDSEQYSSVISSVSGSVINIISNTVNRVFGWAKSL
jgi:serine/threonine protein kinase